MRVVFFRHSSVSDEIIPPLHFAYLASNISDNHEVVIYDQLLKGFSIDNIIHEMKGNPPDVIGFSAYTKDITTVSELLKRIRPHFSDTTIVLGGVQISLMPVETFQYFSDLIDIGFVGESEIAFSKFLNVLSDNPGKTVYEEVPNAVYRKESEIIVNEAIYSKSLDDLNFPAWELIPPGDYPNAPHGAFYKQFPIAQIITSRGCSYPCTFCAARSLSGKKVRYRSVDNIIEEIKLLNKKFGVKEIHIEDDNFATQKSRVIEFSERILNENIGITWAFPNGIRLNNLDIEVLKLMKKAGCYAVNVGVESGSDVILKKIKKRITKDEIMERIMMVKDAGIDIGGFFIIGFPGETKEQILETLKFASKLPLDRIGISYFQPYPGTFEYNDLVDKGEYTIDLSKSKHSLHTISYLPKNLTKKKLKSLRFKGFLSFYLRPAIVIKLLKEIKSLSHFIYILKRAKRWLSN